MLDSHGDGGSWARHANGERTAKKRKETALTGILEEPFILTKAVPFTLFTSKLLTAIYLSHAPPDETDAEIPGQWVLTVQSARRDTAGSGVHAM